jgi:hypothetical protein
MRAVNQRRAGPAISPRAALAILTASILAACGSSKPPATQAASIPPPLAEKPDVIVTFDGARHTCVAALYSEPQGSAVPCADLVAFLRDELRLPNGAIYDVRTVPTFDAAEMTKTAAALKDAGYRFIGGRRDMFSAEPRAKN